MLNGFYTTGLPQVVWIRKISQAKILRRVDNKNEKLVPLLFSGLRSYVRSLLFEIIAVYNTYNYSNQYANPTGQE